MAGQSDWLCDGILNFVITDFFQMPLRTFMERNCLTFYPDTPTLKEHEVIHLQYKELVDELLNIYVRANDDLTSKQMSDSLKLIKTSDVVREMYEKNLNQMLATDNFKLFCQLMTQLNIDLEQEVLKMLMETTNQSAASPRPSAPAAAKKGGQSRDKTDAEVLAQVIRESKAEIANDAEKKKLVDDIVKQSHVTEKEAKALKEVAQAEEEKVQQTLEQLLIVDPPTASGKPAPAKASPRAAAPPPAQKAQPAKAPPSADSGSQVSKVSSAEAAQNWMIRAKEENSQHEAVKSAATEMSKLSADELKKRQDFLKQQRDKLLAKKKAEREKKLESYESEKGPANRGRPQSARAARSAMSGGRKAPAASANPEDEKKLAMRRAIADRLKNEVVGFPDASP